jgi:hypothetical protein
VIVSWGAVAKKAWSSARSETYFSQSFVDQSADSLVRESSSVVSDDTANTELPFAVRRLHYENLKPKMGAIKAVSTLSSTHEATLNVVLQKQ